MSQNFMFSQWLGILDDGRQWTLPVEQMEVYRRNYGAEVVGIGVLKITKGPMAGRWVKQTREYQTYSQAAQSVGWQDMAEKFISIENE